MFVIKILLISDSEINWHLTKYVNDSEFESTVLMYKGQTISKN